MIDTRVAPTSTTNAPTPDTDVVLRVLVDSQGNAKLALDKLRREGYIVEAPQLIDIIKDHLGELKAQMEVVATLELFSLMPVLHKTLIENLSNLEGSDSVTAYMKLMDLITRQTSSNELNLNINDQRFKQAPRELQRVYAELEATGKLQQVIEGEYSVPNASSNEHGTGNGI